MEKEKKNIFDKIQSVLDSFMKAIEPLTTDGNDFVFALLGTVLFVLLAPIYYPYTLFNKSLSNRAKVITLVSITLAIVAIYGMKVSDRMELDAMKEAYAQKQIEQKKQVIEKYGCFISSSDRDERNKVDTYNFCFDLDCRSTAKVKVLMDVQKNTYENMTTTSWSPREIASFTPHIGKKIKGDIEHKKKQMLEKVVAYLSK